MTKKEKPIAPELEQYKLYTLAELEPVLGVTHRTLLSYVYDGKLKAKIIGGKYRVTQDALRDFISAEK